MAKTSLLYSEPGMVTGVELSKILVGALKILGATSGNNCWNHRRFTIIWGTCPGCPPTSMGMVYVEWYLVGVDERVGTGEKIEVGK